MTGNSLIGAIVRVPLPEMLNTIVSDPACEFASRIAWRKDPGPLSSVLLTV